jgi:hypothetical protein
MNWGIFGWVAKQTLYWGGETIKENTYEISD